MNSIGIIREAARLLRERATVATPGPWWARDTDTCWTLHGVGGRLPGWGSMPEQVIGKQILKAPKAGTTMAEYWPDAADAAHMVPMLNPAVALTLAELLDTFAEYDETDERHRSVLAVARAYLGESL